MVPEPPHLVDGFLTDAVEIAFVVSIQVAVHEFLPKHQAQLVGHFIETICLVITPAPHPQHVHVAVDRRLQHAAHLRVGHSRGKAIERDRFAPLANMGMPLTTNVKLIPH